MVVKCGNRDRLLEIEYMELFHEEPQIRTPFLYFTKHRYFPFQLMRKIQSQRKKIRTSCKWFSNVETMTFFCTQNICNYSMRNLQVGSHCCILWTPVFAIPTHENSTKSKKKQYVEVVNGFDM